MGEKWQGTAWGGLVSQPTGELEGAQSPSKSLLLTCGGSGGICPNCRLWSMSKAVLLSWMLPQPPVLPPHNTLAWWHHFLTQPCQLLHYDQLVQGLIFQDSCVQNLQTGYGKVNQEGEWAFTITYGAYYIPNSLWHLKPALFHHSDAWGIWFKAIP